MVQSDPSRRRNMTAAILSPNHNKIQSILAKKAESGRFGAEIED